MNVPYHYRWTTLLCVTQGIKRSMHQLYQKKKSKSFYWKLNIFGHVQKSIYFPSPYRTYFNILKDFPDIFLNLWFAENRINTNKYAVTFGLRFRRPFWPRFPIRSWDVIRKHLLLWSFTLRSRKRCRTIKNAIYTPVKHKTCAKRHPRPCIPFNMMHYKADWLCAGSGRVILWRCRHFPWRW